MSDSDNNSRFDPRVAPGRCKIGENKFQAKLLWVAEFKIKACLMLERTWAEISSPILYKVCSSMAIDKFDIYEKSYFCKFGKM